MKPVVLSVDSSKDGLGAILLQSNLSVVYASKLLNDTQKRYSQIEQELYAVLYGSERFHSYVFGLQSFVMETDHKPLMSLIVKKNFELCPPRLQRMLLGLQLYDFQVVYKRGKDLHIADTLSRAYLNSSDDDSLGSDEIEVLQTVPCKVCLRL